MSRMEIIRSMSHDDALLALQAARATLADNIEGAETAMRAMQTEGLNAFIFILEESIRRKMG